MPISQTSNSNSSLYSYQELNEAPKSTKRTAALAKTETSPQSLRGAAYPTSPSSAVRALLGKLAGATETLRNRRGPGAASKLSQHEVFPAKLAAGLPARVEAFAGASAPEFGSVPVGFAPLRMDEPIYVDDGMGHYEELGFRMLRVQSEGGTFYDLDLNKTPVYLPVDPV